MSNITNVMYGIYSAGAEFEGIKLALEDVVDMETGEILKPSEYDGIVAAFNAIQGENDYRLSVAACVYLELQSQIKQIKEAQDRLKAMADRLDRQSELLKRAMDENCRTTGTERVDEIINGIPVKISYRKSSRVEIDNEADIPEEYWRVKKEVDKTAIKAAIKAGKTIDGAHIEESTNIQIK